MALGCNDDGSGCAGFTSELSVALTAGEEYFIQLGDANLLEGDNHGQGTLTISLDNPPPANDDCSAPETIVGLGGFPFDTSAATTSGFGSGACVALLDKDVFFTWTAPMAGDYRIDTCLAAHDTILSVHSGGGCGATCVAQDDDTCGLQSSVDLLGLSGGEVFLIQVGGFGGQAGAGTLTIDGIVPMGADCSDAIDLGNAAGTFGYDTTGATTSGFAPAGCTVVNKDLFFTWTAPSSADWVFDTCMTGYDTKLSVHDGVDCGATCLGSGDDECGDQSSVTVSLTARADGPRPGRQLRDRRGPGDARDLRVRRSLQPGPRRRSRGERRLRQRRPGARSARRSTSSSTRPTTTGTS